jgi:hypothetical protein
MSRTNVYLLELKQPQPPEQRIMVEAAGPASAIAAYGERAVTLRKLTAGEALKLAREGVSQLEESPADPPAA